MLPGKVPSDLDQDEIGWGEACGRHTILSDLHSEFQGAAGAYGFFAAFLPILILAGDYFGWTDRTPSAVFLGAAAVFIALTAVSLYAAFWSYWTGKRLKAVYKRMELLGAEMKAGKRPYEQP